MYDSKRETRAKLFHPFVIEGKRSDPVLMYPLEVVQVLKYHFKFYNNKWIFPFFLLKNITKTCRNPIENINNAHSIEDEDVNKIAHKYFSLGGNRFNSYVNPFASNYRFSKRKYYSKKVQTQLKSFSLFFFNIDCKTCCKRRQSGWKKWCFS